MRRILRVAAGVRENDTGRRNRIQRVLQRVDLGPVLHYWLNIDGLQAAFLNSHR